MGKIIRKIINNCIEKEIDSSFSTMPVKYIKKINKTILTTGNPIKENIANNWIKYLKLNLLPLDKSERIDIRAGDFYGIPISIIIFVYGPITKKELKNLKKHQS